jgi:hypothetical protein
MSWEALANFSLFQESEVFIVIGAARPHIFLVTVFPTVKRKIGHVCLRHRCVFSKSRLFFHSAVLGHRVMGDGTEWVNP